MPSPSDNGHIDLSLWGISDMELLAIVDDLADENGWTRTLEVRYQLGERMDKGYRSGVGPRLAWMTRYGWLERNVMTARKPGNEREWRLTAFGHALLENPKMSKAFESTFAKLNPAQRLRLCKELAEGADHSVDEIRNAMRRQWQRSMGIGRRR